MIGHLKSNFGERPQTPTRQEMKEAIAYFVLFMNYSGSGEIDDFVINTTLNSLARCKLFADNTQDEDLNLLARLEGKLKEDAGKYAVEYSYVLEHDDWKYTAAALMADVMMADDVAEDSEIELLSNLADDVKITSDELQAIVATIRALRRAWHT